MKFDTVWKILPVVVKKSKNGWGSAKGMFVYMPEGKDETTSLYKHELFHVKQFYVESALIGASIIAGTYYLPFFAVTLGLLAIQNSRSHKTRKELAAYGESVRHEVQVNGKDAQEEIQKYAKIYDDSDSVYDEALTYAEISDTIGLRYRDNRLF